MALVSSPDDNRNSTLPGMPGGEQVGITSNPADAEAVEVAAVQRPEASSDRSQRGRKRAKGGDAANQQGHDLERRVARIEFASGSFVRPNVLLYANREVELGVLTDLDVLSIDVDGRLRLSRGMLECKSGQGQTGEVDRILWLVGVQRLLNLDRATLVRNAISRRGRTVGSRVGIHTLDVRAIEERERALVEMPGTFAHVGGVPCYEAERRTDTQLKALRQIPPQLAAFIRGEALFAEPARILQSIAAMQRAIDQIGTLPSPTREVLAGHAAVDLLLAALQDAEVIDRLGVDGFRQQVLSALTVGDPHGGQMLEVIRRSDDLFRLMLGEVHEAYIRQGAKKISMELPTLEASISSPPTWLDNYIDYVDKIRLNPTVSRSLPQTLELALFDGLLGGSEFESPYFDSLFTAEHQYLVSATIRCLSLQCPQLADAISPVLDLNFSR